MCNWNNSQIRDVIFPDNLEFQIFRAENVTHVSDVNMYFFFKKVCVL